MQIFSQITWPRSGITEYRLGTPLTALEAIAKERKEPFKLMVDEMHPSTTSNTRLLNFHKADVVYTHIAIAVQVYETFAPVKAAIPMWDRTTGQVRVSPAIIIDADDLYTDVSPTNPSFGFWGVHRMDGSMLEPGDKIFVDTADKGPIVLWEDGMIMGEEKQGREADFDVTRNHERIAGLLRLMGEVDMLTVTNHRLRDAYVNKYGIPAEKFYIYPNSVIPTQWTECQVDIKKPDDEIRIMWQGGWSHAEDVYTIKDAMGRVARKYPKTKWYLYGHRFSWFEDAIPEPQRVQVDWTPYELHKLKLNTLAIDINLCPLLDTLFNSCKSPIKWYEATMTKTHPATIAANVGPFMDEMQDGETGFLYDTAEEFEAKLCLLIEQAELRKRLGEAAFKWIDNNRTVAVTAPGLYDAFKEVIARNKVDGRHKPKKDQVGDSGILWRNYSNVGSG